MIMRQLPIPVLLICYNRPDFTKQAISVLRSVRPQKLYIACDGWKTDEDKIQCSEVRLSVDLIDWKCRVYTLFHKHNLGSRDAPYKAMQWFFRHEKMGIILEDDILADSTFFRYAAELLKKYEHDKSIGTISGGNVVAPDISVGGSYYFSRYSQTWGWATWRRAWKLYDIHLKRWPEIKKSGMLARLFPNRMTRLYWTMIFDAVYGGEIRSAWDYQWTFASWVHGLLCIMPSVNMVRNIGIGVKEATHTKHANWMSRIPVRSMEFPLLHPKEKMVHTKADEVLQKRMYILWKELAMKAKRRIGDYTQI